MLLGNLLWQGDWGAGAHVNYLLPTGTYGLIIYLQGAGGGGGGGGSNYGGGGGGAGALGKFICVGNLGSSILIQTGQGGSPGGPPASGQTTGFNGTNGTRDTRVTFNNGFIILAGVGNAGWGGSDSRGGWGGSGSNIACIGNTAPFSSFGQMNLNAGNGSTAIDNLGGWGFRDGDTGGGGGGGNAMHIGKAGQGGYVHIEGYAAPV